MIICFDWEHLSERGQSAKRGAVGVAKQVGVEVGVQIKV